MTRSTKNSSQSFGSVDVDGMQSVKPDLSLTRATGVNQCNLHKSGGDGAATEAQHRQRSSDGMIYTRARASSRINKIRIHFSWYVTTKLSIVNGSVDARVSMRLVAHAEIAKACKSREINAQAEMFAVQMELNTVNARHTRARIAARALRVNYSAYPSLFPASARSNLQPLFNRKSHYPRNYPGSTDRYRRSDSQRTLIPIGWQECSRVI